jgi:Kef-type K+ transport system membrane component KefB
MVTAIGFAFKPVPAGTGGYALSGLCLVRNPLLAAVVLATTSVGLVFSVLEEIGELGSRRDRRDARV